MQTVQTTRAATASEPTPPSTRADTGMAETAGLDLLPDFQLQLAEQLLHAATRMRIEASKSWEMAEVDGPTTRKRKARPHLDTLALTDEWPPKLRWACR